MAVARFFKISSHQLLVVESCCYLSYMTANLILVIFVILININIINTLHINLNPFYDWIRSTTSKSSLRWRKLIGSNCIRIERGEVPPYYDCIG